MEYLLRTVSGQEFRITQDDYDYIDATRNNPFGLYTLESGVDINIFQIESIEQN